MNKQYLNLLLISICMPLMLFFVSPLSISFGNANEYDLNWVDVMAPLILFCFSTLVIFAALKISSINNVLFRSSSGLFLGLSISIWIQSQILLWDLGPLDGRGMDWGRFQAQSMLEIIIWVVTTLLIIYFANRISNCNGIRNIAIVISLVGVTSILTTYITTVFSSKNHTQSYFKKGIEAFSFHQSNNIIVIVLDSFQSDVFQDIINKHSSEVDFLNGFRFYPDVISGYPTTKYSIPSILTGQLYKNQHSFSGDDQYMFYKENHSLPKFFLENGYGVTGDFFMPMIKAFGRAQAFPPIARDFHYFGVSGQALWLLDIGLFRASPLVLKKHIYNESRWLFSSFKSNQDNPPEPHGADFRFVKNFLQHANISSDKTGEFKFIHLIGAHFPLSIDENMQYRNDILTTRDGYTNQARGILALTKKMLEKIKQLGIYEQSTILIIGDHGSHMFAPNDMSGNLQALPFSPEHLAAARPLFLYKPSGKIEPLRVSDAQLHLVDSACILSNFTHFECRDAKLGFEGGRPARKHFRYEWNHEYWFKNFAPPMTLYEVSGDARKVNNWTNTKIIFKDGAVIKPAKYTIGEIINFGKLGKSDNIILRGWSGQENNHTWTDSNVALIQIAMDNSSDEDLHLEIEGFGFSPGLGAPQIVDVFFNGTRVGSWEVLSEKVYRVSIPRKILRNGNNVIEFYIEKPTAPCQLNNKSNDCRKLGLGLKSLRLVR